MRNMTIRIAVACLVSCLAPITVFATNSLAASGAKCQLYGDSPTWLTSDSELPFGTLNLLVDRGVTPSSSGTARNWCQFDTDCFGSEICVDSVCRPDDDPPIVCTEYCDWECGEWVYEPRTRCENAFGSLVCWEDEERVCVDWRPVNCREVCS